MGYYKKLAGAGYRPTRAGATTKPTTKPVTSTKKVFSFSIEGLPEVTAKLKAFEPKLARKYLSQATRAAAKMVLGAAKQAVPVLSGALQKSLRVRAKVRTKKNKADIGHAVTTGKGWFKGDTYYGGFIEFGTKHIAERRFMRDAAAKTEPAAREEFKRKIQAAVDAAAMGGTS